MVGEEEHATRVEQDGFGDGHGRSTVTVDSWVEFRSPGKTTEMASYTVNEAAVARARELIDARQYVIGSDWGEVQPKADDGNTFLDAHSWDEYAAWHLALTAGANDETKARYAFVYGDFRRVHRTGLIACQYRAAEWEHKAVELAAHDLLQHLDQTRA
jgi:pimeloyl-ACP methyl ester carboxylesterase